MAGRSLMVTYTLELHGKNSKQPLDVSSFAAAKHMDVSVFKKKSYF